MVERYVASEIEDYVACCTNRINDSFEPIRKKLLNVP